MSVAKIADHAEALIWNNRDFRKPSMVYYVRPMYFLHAPDIWKDFPELTAGVLVIDGLTADSDVHSEVETWYAKARERLAKAQEADMPEIAAWRRAFGTMNLKPTQYRCAAESLLRRFRKENDLPHFHPAVDIGNALSMAFATPIALYDTAKLKHGIEVRRARGDEKHLNFGDEIETPEPGEVIFADEDGHAHSRRWCFRQSKKSVVTKETQKILIVTEMQHENAEGNMRELLEALTEAFTKFWNAPAKQQMLSAENPRFEFD